MAHLVRRTRKHQTTATCTPRKSNFHHRFDSAPVLPRTLHGHRPKNLICEGEGDFGSHTNRLKRQVWQIETE